MVLKVQKVGNSLGLVLPVEATKKLRVAKGDQLFLSETQEGYTISPYDPNFAETMRIAGGVMKRYRNALHDLAK